MTLNVPELDEVSFNCVTSSDQRRQIALGVMQKQFYSLIFNPYHLCIDVKTNYTFNFFLLIILIIAAIESCLSVSH